MHLYIYPDVLLQVWGTEWTVTLTGLWHGHLCGLAACESHLRFSWQMLQISLPWPESASDLLAMWSELNPNLGMRTPSVACHHCDARSVHGREHRQLQLQLRRITCNGIWWVICLQKQNIFSYCSFSHLIHFWPGTQWAVLVQACVRRPIREFKRRGLKDRSTG